MRPLAEASVAETWIAQTGFSFAPRGRRRARREPLPGIEFRLQEQLGEGRVGLVGAAVIQADLRVAGQVDLAGPAAVVDERHHADFGVGVRRHADGPAGLDVAVPAAELGPVGMELVLVFLAGPAQRLVADRPEPAVGQVADVAELAPAVAGRILAPAGHVQAPPGAEPAPAAVTITPYRPLESRATAGGSVSFVAGRTDPAGDAASGAVPVPSVEVAIELFLRRRQVRAS